MRTWFSKPLALVRLATLAVLASVVSPAMAQTASDYTQSAASTSATQVKISFRPTTPAVLVDVHYNVPGVPTQSFRMAHNAGTWEQTINNLAAGAQVEYWFTYEKGGPLYVTPRFYFTHGGSSGGTVATPAFSPPGGSYGGTQSVAIASATSGATIRYTQDGSTPSASSPIYGGPVSVSTSRTLKAIAMKSGMTTSAVATATYTIGTPQAGDGRFPIVFVNNTRGFWRDDQVYVFGLAMNASNQWCYMKADGTMVPVNPADENAPNHLTKNGRNYANYAFTIAQAKASNFRSPTHVRGGRLYISVGSPVYIPIGVNAWGGPDLLNPNDPNADVYYDWYEYTYVHNTDVAFGGNTGMVDQFGIPLTHRVVNAALGFDATKGTTGTRDAIMAGFRASVPPAFQGLANAYRVKAPYKDSFRPGMPNASYLQAYIDQVWNQYAANEFRLQRLGDLFVGRVVNGRLQFTKNGIGPFFIDKPSTFDVFACSGALARGAQTELELEAELCAAFNRGVAQTTSNWANPSSYYTNTMKNEYAAYWHRNGIGGKAYAFAYDDVNDQSSVIILPNLPSRPYPDSVTITIGW
jgi:hypothetical protein